MNNRNLLLMASCVISSHLTFAQAIYDETFMELPIVKNIQLSTGVEIQYVEQGAVSGTPVIFLHGFTDSWYSYEKAMMHLPFSIHAYVLSQRGHGLSSKPQKGYKPEDFTADVEAFMKELEIPSAIIVGHSMGSVIAQRFAIDHPERTRALVLIGAFANIKKNPGIVEFGKIVEQLQDPIDSVFVHEFQKGTLAKELDGMELHTYVSESRLVPARVWKELMYGLMDVDYEKELKKVKAPALILYGDKDMIVPESDQQVLAGALKNSTRITYKGTGHGLHWEEPERFAEDLCHFISKLP
ncbi:alpha/beta fold hydrolase [Chitinophaga sp. SYP-B3965]|uniref:alpha/beta fold hydrolase n=1 Tax=Chitinophaga sp. SYP-B3965 TaxID=2663120 RepID=UPI00129995F0|nr:alpha/beta hydrolase [Chitinophaga sp. SYP-B3965]MRG48360.1 alpha/beta fold hydrolase [Chitinophaga sp. SYP-B3965]